MTTVCSEIEAVATDADGLASVATTEGVLAVVIETASLVIDAVSAVFAVVVIETTSAAPDAAVAAVPFVVVENTEDASSPVVSDSSEGSSSMDVLTSCMGGRALMGGESPLRGIEPLLRVYERALRCSSEEPLHLFKGRRGMEDVPPPLSGLG